MECLFKEIKERKFWERKKFWGKEVMCLGVTDV